MRIRGWLAAALMLDCLLVPRVRAQVVRGFVREIGAKAALSNVEVVLLFGNGDSVVAKTTTDRSGGFRVRAPVGGSYSVGLRRVGFEPLVTTSVNLGASDTLVIALEMIRSAVALDTVRIKEGPNFLGVTSGSGQFLSHYQRGVGLFISGYEVQAARVGIGEYIAKLPGFTELGIQKNPADYAGGGTRAEDFGKPTRLRQGNDPLDGSHFVLQDEKGRNIVSVDAPCVTTRVDRIGPVVGIVGTDLRVQHVIPNRPKPLVGVAAPNPDPVVASPEVTVHLKEIIGIELYRTPDEVPAEWRARGQTAEEQRDMGRCAFIQFWTRTAW